MPLIHRFTGGPIALRQNEATSIRKQRLSPFEHFHALFFLNYATVDGRHTQILPPIFGHIWWWIFATARHDYTENVFVSVCYYTDGHDQRETGLKITGPHQKSFYGCLWKHIQMRFFHILQLVHFCDNTEPGKTDRNYGRLWKMRTTFDKLCHSYNKYYSPTCIFTSLLFSLLQTYLMIWEYTLRP
jgi:hypothetical protein